MKLQGGGLDIGPQFAILENLEIGMVWECMTQACVCDVGFMLSPAASLSCCPTGSPCLQTGAVIQARAKEAQQQLQQAGKQLGTYGHKLLVGTSELFDQIKEAVQNEMAFEGPSEGGPRRMPSKRQLANAQGAKFSR